MFVEASRKGSKVFGLGQHGGSEATASNLILASRGANAFPGMGYASHVWLRWGLHVICMPHAFPAAYARMPKVRGNAAGTEQYMKRLTWGP